MSVTIKVPIPDDLLPVLARKAKSAGLEQEEYAGAIMSRELNGPRTLEEVLAAFRDQVAESGIADRDLDDLFRGAGDDADKRDSS
jgi:hypothetical protein